MRRRGGDDDARLADLEPADPVVHGRARADGHVLAPRRRCVAARGRPAARTPRTRETRRGVPGCGRAPAPRTSRPPRRRCAPTSATSASASSGSDVTATGGVAMQAVYSRPADRSYRRQKWCIGPAPRPSPGACRIAPATYSLRQRNRLVQRTAEGQVRRQRGGRRHSRFHACAARRLGRPRSQ